MCHYHLISCLVLSPPPHGYTIGSSFLFFLILLPSLYTLKFIFCCSLLSDCSKAVTALSCPMKSIINLGNLHMLSHDAGTKLAPNWHRMVFVFHCIGSDIAIFSFFFGVVHDIFLFSSFKSFNMMNMMYIDILARYTLKIKSSREAGVAEYLIH